MSIIESPRRRRALLRTAARILFVLAAGYALWWLADFAMTRADGLSPEDVMLRHGLLLGLLLVYALLIAVPFVPGAEIGLTLLAMGGASVAPLVYAATLLGLLGAYLVGCRLGYARLSRLLRDLGARGLARRVDLLEPLHPEERLAMMRDRLPRWLARIAVRGRYLLLAVLVNLPGNSLLGGGGGLCLLAGLSRLYRPGATALTLALAILPVPLLAWMWWPGLAATP